MGDIILKIWANCANCDTSMNNSDKHYDTISFTHGLLAINYFHFFKMATVFFKMAIFFHTEYTFEWNTVSDTLFISIKTTVNITGMPCFQMMFSVDVLHKLKCACAYFTTFYQFDSLFLIQFNLNNWCKNVLMFVFVYFNIFQVIYLRMRKLFHI